MKRERLTDRDLLEGLLLPEGKKGPGMVDHPNYLERILMGIPESEEEDRDWMEDDIERKLYDGPIHEIYFEENPETLLTKLVRK